MTNYLQSYPLLSAELRFQTTDAGLSEEQSEYMIKRGLDENAGFRVEIIRSFEDPDFFWMEILNHPDIGEVYEAETEEEAREFATEMFLNPALEAKS